MTTTTRIIAAGLLRQARALEPGAQAWDICLLACSMRHDYPAYSQSIYEALRDVACRFGISDRAAA